MPERRLALAGYALALLVLLLDQGSKAWASSVLDYARPVPVLPFFNLTLHHNPGAAFSFLSDAGGWQRWFFTGLALVVSAALAVWLRSLSRTERVLALGLSLVLGGALGNLVDRLQHGYVVDFISLHYAGHYFPTFNIADSAITVGAALLVLDSLRGSRGDGAQA
ncbi:signal peptidase II [Pseudohaliea rubra]|uniref:Lipoprotein signal peptidase n=1 Tax=Pseudohaliea rubra DSM 19751 TaxID=1265313 RepID=A0A095VQK1_9GAMM|nr:signal peptidase II [Pseudohaliea rubra]KGE03737.1 Lipoprotein signal peptidase [Pseudohaliea rubra DSM 19751]